ncbi:Tabersonine 16-O-methyltransferase [Capsicum annuum]|uniref:Tabersonine 16-O-methyltransferase n=1 Tax=Capsicum annuum TaxID=4072 RepID=A0A2G2ZMG1_CAPAN|nr:Tabersonine 16-O-methyltransferase [Capsicum annuum]
MQEINNESNLKFIGGSMFDEIPHANAILLKCILHDWSDNDYVKILKKCKESIPSKHKGGNLIIIDIVMEEGLDKLISDEFDRAKHFMDVMMMTLYAAKERTKKKWEKFFDEAGFNEYKMTPLGLRSLIEVYP